MVQNVDSFAARFEQLRGETSYQKLSDAVAAQTGVRISAQAMHKWVQQDGGITLENAKVIAEYFKVSPGWLLFGEGEGRPPTIDSAIRELPAANKQQSIDYLEYQLKSAAPFMAAEKLAHYMTMIEGFKRDIARRRRENQQ